MHPGSCLLSTFAVVGVIGLQDELHAVMSEDPAALAAVISAEGDFLFETYAIALPKRRDYVVEQFQSYGLLPSANIRAATTPKDIKNGWVHNSCDLNEKEIACSLSHHFVYSHFMENSTKEYALIFEDDFALDDKFKSISVTTLVNDVIDTRPKLNWDVVNLGRCADCCSAKCSVAQHELKQHGAFIVKSPNAYCANAYLVNRKGARVLMENSMPIQVISDDVLRDSGKKNLFNYYAIAPRIFRQRREEFGSELSQLATNSECLKCRQNCTYA